MELIFLIYELTSKKGTGDLGYHADQNKEKEIKKIQKELKRLGLRKKS